ncbi:MAG: (d)CMP kinase [Actinomycetota bacterium]|nr:(d)CMP kinase [Actinomycetota bacterium]
MHRGDGLRGVVAVDGPAGTGKSTVARRLAAWLGARYLDTGAMYRAAALGVLRAGVDTADADAVSEVVARSHIEVGTDPASSSVLLEGEDVSREIRGSAVTTAVSPVSAVSQVRGLLVAQQRRIIVDATAGGGIVVEGRDIGTVVVPDAPLKVFLTATAAQRAARRAAQDGVEDLAEVRRAVERRDRFDSTRATSPMCAAGDAVELDTTALDIEAVLGRLHELAVARGLVVLEVRGRT